MAAEDGVYPARWDNLGDCKVITTECLDELQMMMEKLHSRSKQYRSWTETIKAVRLAITNDKWSQSDALKRSTILSCVDKLQKAIKVENQQTLLEKLESIARQLNLTFSPPILPDKPASISCDMFTVDITMDTKGIVKDVRVSHQGEPVSCEELTEVLSRENYDEFSGHLQGFLSIYDIPGDKKQKSKAYLALQSLETDLNDLAQLQSSIKGVSNCIHKSPLGILLPRKGGYPMKLIYFVSPYDLLDKRSKTPHPMTVEAITENGLGQNVTVCIQQSPVSSRLQTMPLMSVVPKDGKSLPSFQGLSNVNSCMLSACFVLVLPQPIPVALSVIRCIKNVTNLDVITEGEENSLRNLLLKEVFKCKAEDEFYITLPDQQHVFYMNDINGCSLEQPAVMVSKIPFTHPTNVAQVLNSLRQQLIFNTVIGSSIRPNASQECSVVFELNALSLQQMNLSFEHPLHNTMVTAEIDLSDITYPKLKVIYTEEEQSICSEELASKIFQRCFSVPVTLRSVINKVSDEIRKEPTPEPVSVIIPSDRAPPWPPEYFPGNYSPGKLPLDMKNISPNNMAFRNFNLQQHSPQGMFGLMGGIGAALTQPPTEGILIEPPAPEKPHNPLLADLLDRSTPSPTEPPKQTQQTEAPIMSQLLQDSTTAVLASSIPHPPPQKPKQVRQRKRSSKSDVASHSRSPKHPRLSETESNGSVSHDFDSNAGSFDFGDQVQQPHHGHSHGHPTLTRQLSIIDLTDVETPGFSAESNMQKLESMVGNKLPRQPHRQDSELSQLLSDMGDTSPSKDTNSPHHYFNSVPKNDNASTSHEENILSGSREVLKTTDPTSPNYAHQSLIDLLIKSEEPNAYDFSRQNSNLSLSRTSSELNNRKLSAGSLLSNSLSDLSDNDTMPYKEKSTDSSFFNLKMTNSRSLQSSDSGSSLTIKREIKDEKDIHDLRTLLTQGKDKSENNVIEKDVKYKKEDIGGKNIKIKVSTVQGLRQSSLPNELLHISKHKSEAPFDFHSDEEDGDPFDFRDKSTMKVISSSPTRLQISGKHKLYNHKIKDKEKKKEKCNNISGEKRKKDKNESKKEKKKKQKLLENYKSTSLDESAIYKSVAVVSEDSNSGSNQKPIPKLKINKSSLSMSVGKSPNRDIFSNKNENVKKSKEKDDKHFSSGSKKSQKYQRGSPSNSITVSKSDSKLITKTPTIKLKPIAMPTNSVSISSAKTPPAYSTTSSTKGSSTPTSTTIGRLGALTKSGSLTPPASVKATTPTSASSVKFSTPTSSSGVKASTPTSASGVKATTPNSVSNVKATTPTSVSKSFPGNKLTSKSTSSLPTAGKISSQRTSNSSSGRNSSDGKEVKRERNGSSSGSKSSAVRKSSSPMAGSRNPLTLSKSSHSSSKNSSSSTSSPFSNKNQSVDVLSFLNKNSSIIANLPPIPKLGKTNSNTSSSAANKVSTTEVSSSKPVSTTVQYTRTNSSPTVSAKTNTTNSISGISKNSASSNVTSSKLNTSSSKPNSSTSSPSQTKTVTTPTSVKQNPLNSVSKNNNIIPSCSGGFSRAVTTVTCTTSSLSKTVTSTSSVTSSKMTTSVTTVITSSSSKSSASMSQSSPTVKSVSQSSPTVKSVSSSGASVSQSSPTVKSVSSSGASQSSPTVKSVSSSGASMSQSSPTVKSVSSSGDSLKKPTQQQSLSTVPSTCTSTVTAAQSGNQSCSQNTNQTTSSSSNMVHKPRPRKGSLTAVIDKLTKQTSHGPCSDNEKKEGQETSTNSSSLSESDKNCKTEKVEIHNSKVGHDKNVNCSKDSNSQGKVRKEDKEGKSNSSSPKTKSAENTKKRCDSPTKSNSGKENKNDDSRNLFTSILKSASETSYSPKEKGGKTNDSRVDIDQSEENSAANSSQTKIGDKNCHLESSPKDKIVNTNKHSRTPSPKQNSRKFNGETKDGVNEKGTKESDKDVFKVPTPKTNNSEEKDSEDTENFIVRKKARICTSKPILSPSSPVSSPENLIIDCQTLSPRTLQNKTNSPNIDVSSEKLIKAKTTSPIHKIKQSPVLHMDHSGSFSNPSPTDIDDDLMNEAVMGVGS